MGVHICPNSSKCIQQIHAFFVYQVYLDNVIKMAPCHFEKGKIDSEINNYSVSFDDSPRETLRLRLT